MVQPEIAQIRDFVPLSPHARRDARAGIAPPVPLNTPNTLPKQSAALIIRARSITPYSVTLVRAVMCRPLPDACFMAAPFLQASAFK